jgi:hypothetical protein
MQIGDKLTYPLWMSSFHIVDRQCNMVIKITGSGAELSGLASDFAH